MVAGEARRGEVVDSARLRAVYIRRSPLFLFEKGFSFLVFLFPDVEVASGRWWW
jgi:hypothetical protein